jgi:hypothetical protein
MSLSKFGPFARVFETGEFEVPGHLELLHLRNEGAQVVISRIEHAVSVGDPARWIRALLEGPNWRPHLVAAVAMLVVDGAPCCVDGLWGAVDTGSWVTPQLVVAAFLLDDRIASDWFAQLTRSSVVTEAAYKCTAEWGGAKVAGVGTASDKLGPRDDGGIKADRGRRGRDSECGGDTRDGSLDAGLRTGHSLEP